jgi:hypothetical protein
VAGAREEGLGEPLRCCDESLGLFRSRMPCVRTFWLRIQIIGYSLHALDVMAFRVEGERATQNLPHCPANHVLGLFSTLLIAITVSPPADVLPLFTVLCNGMSTRSWAQIRLGSTEDKKDRNPRSLASCACRHVPS